jgi:hypothetical protein
MVTYVSGTPPIIVDERAMADMLDGGPVRAALHVDTDPITGVAMVSVFHDDGGGNGDCIFSLPFAEIKALVLRFGVARLNESRGHVDRGGVWIA